MYARKQQGTRQERMQKNNKKLGKKECKKNSKELDRKVCKKNARN